MQDDRGLQAKALTDYIRLLMAKEPQSYKSQRLWICIEGMVLLCEMGHP